MDCLMLVFDLRISNTVETPILYSLETDDLDAPDSTFLMISSFDCKLST